jgi:hypothetical protein
MKEKEKNKISRWESLVDQLQAQLEKGSEEAREEFEEQKEHLSTWLISMNEKLDRVKDKSGEKALKLRASLEELRVRSAHAKAETKDQIAEQQKHIAEGIHKLRQEISETYDEAREDVKDIHEKMDDELHDFETRFDLFRLQLHLGEMEAEESWEQKRKDLTKKLSHLKTLLKTKSKEIEGRWDEFSDEISEKWKQIRDIK